ncbi:MAG: hypothetical protein JNN07_21365 [Verrucomicrobiales bacterium]|nr:hypothetical protein [Verrucomicrobiales bacterium]
MGISYSRPAYPWLLALLAVVLPVTTVLAQAPSLQRVTLAASSVDITTGSPKIGVEIQFTAPGLLKLAYVNFVNAAGDKVVSFVDLGYPAPIPSYSGSTFSREIFLAQGRAPGEWQVMVELTDQNNVKTVYGGPGNPALPAGSTSSVTFVNSGVADTQWPVLISGSVTPNPVTSGGTEQDLVVTVQASDDRELQDIRVGLVPPTGSVQYHSLNASTIISGNRQSGTWRRTVKLPPFSPAGEWRIRYEVFDRSNRGRTYVQGSGLVPPPAAQPTLTVVNTGSADTSGPVVTAISFSRSSVNVTAASQQVIATVTVHDTPSGLRGARLFLINARGENTLDIPFFSGSPPYPATPVEETIGATVPRYIAPGTYRWRVVSLDGQARESVYGFGGLPFPGGVSDELTVQNTGPVEAARPVLMSNTLSPLEIRPVEFTSVPVTITARVTDDVGVSKVELRFQDSDRPSSQRTRFMTRTAGTAQDGTWSTTFNVGTDYQEGTYRFGFAVYDAASIFPVEYGAYGGALALPLPVGSPTQLTILSYHSEGHAYSVWRGQYPSLAGPSGEPNADPDGDSFVNVVEFLCGTNPLLNSSAGGTDPAAARAPRLAPKKGYLRMEYRLSAANAALGTGNAYRLEPQATPSLTKTPWTQNVPQGKVSNTDLYWAELPMGVPELFMRLRVRP